ncbi:MAG: hypothetical protein IPK35_20665 [Saprospiraceae bacterium]|jgi:hypothetical protein|nr:hypothetical protein [Saprospiraceae bacterium]
MALKWLERQDLDVLKWEQCIDDSLFPSLFARSWYLDIMTDGRWQAIIDENYKAVFPVLKKKKFGLPYITMPFLCQRTGIVTLSDHHTDPAAFSKILLARNLLKMDLKMASPVIPLGKTNVRVNHILPLTKSYQDIRKSYHRNTVRNITTSQNSGTEITVEYDVNLMFNFIKNYDITGLTQKFSHNVQQLLSQSIQKGSGFGLKATLNDELVSIGFFILDSERLYFLLCASNENGKRVRSMYQMIDYIIQYNASKKLILDFTGSSAENIARRNEGFGAEKEIYYHLKWNILGL